MKETRARGLTIALLVTLAVLAVWNAAKYPPGDGYDAIDHIAYAEGIRQGEEFRMGSGVLHASGLLHARGGPIELGDRLGLGDPHRLVLLMNAFLAFSTALLVVALGRELWPGHHALHVAALGFFVCVPLVLKTAAMFHPETLDLFLSTLALLLAARMIVRDDIGSPSGSHSAGARRRPARARLLTLDVRGFVLALAGQRSSIRRRRKILAATLAMFAATSVVEAGTSTSRRHIESIFDQPQVPKPLRERRPVDFYVDPGLPELVTRPYRPSQNLFSADALCRRLARYFGVYSWQPTRGVPSQRELTAESLAGLLPTALAVGGWLWLLVSSVRRLRSKPELLLITLLPLAGIVGMFYCTSTTQP